MGKHKGQAKQDLKAAMESAADAAHQASGAGDYEVDAILVQVQSNPAAAPGTNPIRDYTVTLSGP